MDLEDDLTMQDYGLEQPLDLENAMETRRAAVSRLRHVIHLSTTRLSKLLVGSPGL